jgi:hypothetical protein
MLISEFLEMTCSPHILVMPGNYDLHADEGLEYERKVISLLEEVEVLHRVDMGMNIAVVRCHGAK